MSTADVSTRLALGPDGRVRHTIGPAEISNDLAGWIAEDLIAPGALSPSDFESTFVEIVTSIDPGWTAFYRNTLAELATGGRAGGTIAETAPVHRRAAELVTGGDVVELGCCFGFLSLALAATGRRVAAVDVAPGTVGLLRRVAPELLAPNAGTLHAVAGDAGAVPLAADAADTVLAVHLLEHLPPAAAPNVVAEAVRVARRRVVVAVPFEDTPNPAWGHVRTFDLDALAMLGAATGLPHRVFAHHGGWLIVDLP